MGAPGGAGGFASNASGGPMDHGAMPGSAANSAGAVHSGLLLGPPGRWWDDKHYAKDLKLSREQQRRMDGIFEANRATLLRRLQDLQVEQARMSTVVRGRVDEASLDAEIDRVSLARAELEKATCHVLLQIRSEMSAEQVARLEQHQP